MPAPNDGDVIWSVVPSVHLFVKNLVQTKYLHQLLSRLSLIYKRSPDEDFKLFIFHQVKISALLRCWHMQSNVEN